MAGNENPFDSNLNYCKPKNSYTTSELFSNSLSSQISFHSQSYQKETRSPKISNLSQLRTFENEIKSQSNIFNCNSISSLVNGSSTFSSHSNENSVRRNIFHQHSTLEVPNKIYEGYYQGRQQYRHYHPQQQYHSNPMYQQVKNIMDSPVNRSDPQTFKNPSYRFPRNKIIIQESNTEIETSPSKWTKLDLSNGMLIRLSPTLFEYTHITHLLLNKNCLNAIPPEICLLTQLKQVDFSENQIKFVPKELSLLSYLFDLNLATNQIERIPYELALCTSLEQLDLANNPLPERVKVAISKGFSSLYTLLVEESPISLLPPLRTWLMTGKSESKPNNFSVFSYNILCDVYSTSQMYKYCPSRALKWEYRKILILNELSSSNADILCLQEVETSQYHGFFTPELRSIGYEGFFYPKARARTMVEDERRQVDGCAIFIRTSMFVILEESLVDIGNLALSIVNPSPHMINRVTNKDNVAIVCLLEHRQTKEIFYVANVHIHWNPEYKDVKVIQTALLLNELYALQKTSTRGYMKPLILAGDFNSLPESGVIKFLRNGYLSCDDIDLLGKDYGDFVGKELHHPFKLNSAYENDIEYTNYTSEFKGIIDYIWYTEDKFINNGRLLGYNDEYLSTLAGFPSDHHPSDHIPLLCEFELDFKNP